MKHTIYFMITFCFLIGCKETFKKNLPPIKNVTNVYFEDSITDPYRYMENLTDTIFLDWLKLQEKTSKEVLKTIPNRASFLENLNEEGTEESFSVSSIKITENDYYYYLKKNASEDRAQLYIRKGIKGKEKLLFNPQTLKLDNETHVINYIEPSWDDSKIAIGLTKKDEEFSKIIIIDIKTEELIGDIVDHIWPNALGGIEWLPDNSGFIYTHIPDIDNNSKEYLLNCKAVLYKIEESSLKEVFSKENNVGIPFNEEDFPLVYITNSYNKYILGAIAGVARYRDTYFASVDDLDKNKINWILLFGKEEKIDQFFVDGSDLYYKTAKKATNFKICKTSLENPNFNNPEILVEEDENSSVVITDFTLVKNGVYYVKTKNGVEASLYHLDKGVEKKVQIPKLSGYINITSKNSKSNDLWMVSEGWISKKERYRFDFESSKFVNENLSPVHQYKELEDVIIEEIEVVSHDGEKVPLSIIYKKGLKKDGNNRVLLNGYGAYKWSNSPYLYPYLLHWVKGGGIYVAAHVRGGGEKGESWHKGGYKTTKPNTWKDFISCAEYLVTEKYTTSKKMAIWGASAGGINIGRAVTERPDLFAAAVIRVGILNPLRIEVAPNGKNNAKEFGTVTDNIEFKALLEMDAYHHVKEGIEYPAIYLTAGINDARVPAWQPAKFAARMQHATISDKPVLLSVDFEGGHGFDALVNKKNEELTDIMSFLLWQTGHPDYQVN